MKKNSVIIIASICIFIFALRAFAWYAYTSDKQLEILQFFNQSMIFVSHKWISADTIIFPIAGVRMTNSSGDIIEPFYFTEFEYTPDIKTDLLKNLHEQNNFSVPDDREDKMTYFYVKYEDIYDNPPSAGYPKLTLVFPNGSTQTYIMSESATAGVYFCEVLLDGGEYRYTYTATNDNYKAGEYSISGNWYVTTKPYDFNPILPVDNVEIIPDIVNFQWMVKTKEAPDILKYELYLGFENNKAALPLYGTAFSVNAPLPLVSGERTLSGLNHKKRYFWYMKISNKYGAYMETELYSFITGGMIEKFYNAPNPFNPAKGLGAL